MQRAAGEEMTLLVISPAHMSPSGPDTGGTMLRKHLLTDVPEGGGTRFGEKDIAALATVWVTSEAADAPGTQRLILAFDAPQTLRTLRLKIEEREVHRTQDLQVAISRDGGHTYQELLRQEYTFSPPGTTFE